MYLHNQKHKINYADRESRPTIGAYNEDYHEYWLAPPDESKYEVPSSVPPRTPSIRANLISSDGFQCRFLWFMNQLLICFWSRPVSSESFNFSSSCYRSRKKIGTTHLEITWCTRNDNILRSGMAIGNVWSTIREAPSSHSSVTFHSFASSRTLSSMC